MSTTFEVYPGTRELPTFEALLERSTRELHVFLDAIGVGVRPQIHVRLHRRADDAHLPFSLRDPLRWDSKTYAWFMVGEVPGGTDAYFRDDADRIAEEWRGELDAPRCKPLESLIRACEGVGHGWTFRRSAGQTAVINLAYGLIAGSLAAMTEGFIYSCDSAWDWERMPARPDDFLRFYFRPELALEDGFRDWSRRCILALGAELRGETPLY